MACFGIPENNLMHGLKTGLFYNRRRYPHRLKKSCLGSRALRGEL